MITLLGIACVGWTAFELSRLACASAPAARLRESGETDAAAQPYAGPERRRGRRPSGRFNAWDDRGRPITVVDVGAR